MKNLTAAQQAQQHNRTPDGRYAEGAHADPGNLNLGGEPSCEPCATRHPDVGCADVGCAHNCEAWIDEHHPNVPTEVSSQITLQRWGDHDDLFDLRTVDVDLVQVLARLTPEQHADLLDELDSSYADYHTGELIESLLYKTGRLDLLGGHSGPWTADVDVDEMRDWLLANPAWVEDGVTPHPTGGYTRIVRNDQGIAKQYRNAAGELHRLDGPAQHFEHTMPDGSVKVYEAWMVHNQYHRPGGLPAVIDGRNGVMEWWQDGKQYAGLWTDSDEKFPTPTVPPL